MSWSDDAQSSKSGTSSKTAGDPVVPCVEQALLEPLIDFNEPSEVAPVLEAPEQSAVRPLVSVEPGLGPLSSKIETGPSPSPSPSPSSEGES
jgi:hypothetical protein